MSMNSKLDIVAISPTFFVILQCNNSTSIFCYSLFKYNEFGLGIPNSDNPVNHLIYGSCSLMNPKKKY